MDMDIRNSLEGLRTLLGVNPAVPAAPQAKETTTPAAPGAWGSDSANVSSAASEMSNAASEEGVHMDKVAAVQQAVAAGTYNVPASDVASKLVDAMLTAGR
jgi:negative regulator of flagellin synthesis FlgM